MLDACSPNEDTKLCDDAFNHTYVKESIMATCIGKKSWTINVASFVDTLHLIAYWIFDIIYK